MCLSVTACNTKPATGDTSALSSSEGEADQTGVFAANVLDYGADPTGTEDSTEAIQKACAQNRLVSLPAGTYLISKLSILGSVTIQGAGNNVTVLKTTELTGNVLTFRGDGWHLKDLKLDAVDNRTDGAYVYSEADFASIRNVSMTRQYIGFDLNGSWHVDIENTYAYDGTPHEVAPGGAVIRLGKDTYTGPVNIRGLTARPIDVNHQPSTCISLHHVDVVSISDALIIWHKKDVLIAPEGKSQFSALVEITNSCFDTAENGIFIQPKDNARVLRVGIANTWFGAHTSDGAVIDATEGYVTGVQFTNSTFIGNGGNGVTVRGNKTDGIFFSNSFSGANQGHGLEVSLGARNVVWSGGAIGNCQGGYGNVKYGYSVDPGCSGSVINCLLTGNTQGAFHDPDQVFTAHGNTL